MNQPLMPLIPAGAAYFPAAPKALPGKFAFLILPGFTLLAFSALVDPFRIANQLSQSALYHWRVLSETGAPVTSSCGITLQVDGALPDLDRDTILIVCSGTVGAAPLSARLRTYLARHYRFGGRVGGVCTGAVALAQAGLLEGHAFTLHWENQPGFCERFPDLAPSAHSFEIDGRILTCGGGVAATDLALTLIEADHGAEFAQAVSDMCLHRGRGNGAVPQRVSVAARLRARNPVVTRALAIMTQHLDDPLPSDAIAMRLGISRRHLERVFLRNLGVTPARHYTDLRLDRARSLLIDTDLTLIEVATACGFASRSYFSKAFQARFGNTPSDLMRPGQQARPRAA